MFVEVASANLPPMKHITFSNAHELKTEKHQDIQTQLKQSDKKRRMANG
jgi:hypothetical protein